MSDADDHLRLDDQLCFALYSTVHALNRAYKPLLEPLGLTYPQYLVLLVLWEDGAQTVGGIGERVGLESSTLTPLLKRMESAGLIKRARKPEDERVVQITLTEAGKALRDKAKAVPPALLCAMGGDLETVVKLRAEVTQLRGALAAAGQ
ncbi:MarR family winged helix-turn-helix transcriptional regulator [Caulobacter sp. NIBR2454]|uniref:MarR family winged helix-turn-helix transcriptional regulator n=1 Tax=Caulobacter sp. NIBR2454 TaxID=3015996 RepID=UPI0022B66E20|nr:MarR family transcriptional regulator [Caulobacter sp. NIBR2454]